MEKGGDLVTGYFPGSFSEIAQKNRTTCNTAKKTLKQFCETGSTCYESHAAGSKHLQQDDLNFMQLLKISRASMATGEVYRYVNEFFSAAGRNVKCNHKTYWRFNSKSLDGWRMDLEETHTACRGKI